MKTIVIGIVAMLGLTGALHAKKGERKGGDGQLFAKLDTDGDGMVSKQEWEANWSGKGKRNRGNDGADGRNCPLGGQRDGQKGGPGKGKGRPGPGGAGRGAGGDKGGAR